MIIETERLQLIPLLPQQLRAWIEDRPALERELNMTYQAEPLEGIFLEIVKGQLAVTEAHPEDYLCHSFWLIVRKSDRVVVGSADFKDVPDGRQEVEIGYGLGQAFEHQGYMTEAVQAMCDWALAQENVAHILAETEVDGWAS